MDDKADELAAIAIQCPTRVRDEEPAAFHRWLRSMVPTEDDKIGLIVALSAAVPTDRTWSQLIAWTRMRHLDSFGDGRPDTPEKIAQRRRDLEEALHRRAA